jgi:hypothetical protein
MLGYIITNEKKFDFQVSTCHKALTTITFDVALPHIPNLWNHLHEPVEKLIDVAPISTLAYGQYSNVLVYIKDQLMVV